VEDIDPADTFHVTEVFDVFATVGRNCCVPVEGRVSEPGAKLMLTGGCAKVRVNVA
jgi:hypothetical protein